MDKEHVKGAADKAKGAVKDAAGKMTDDKKLQAEGKMDKAKGSARQALGDAKRRRETRIGKRVGRETMSALGRLSGRPFRSLASLISFLELPSERRSCIYGFLLVPLALEPLFYIVN